MECNKKLDMKGNKMEESHTTELENQIRTLNRIVIEGNGVQPLTVRENKINLILTGIGLMGFIYLTAYNFVLTQGFPRA